MKTFRILTLLALGFLASGCKSPTEGPNEIGGDVNIPLNTIGNDYGVGVALDNTYITLHDTMYVMKNENGLVTYKVWADLSGNPLLKALLPSNRLDSAGNLNTTVHFKMTSEGIQDYRLAKSDFSKPFTIVKYSGNVGDSWTFTTSDGKTITRQITQKSSTDDFSYGFMLIKTNTTEETPVNDLPGVAKLKYITNHKFGLVQIVVVLTDGRQLKITLFPTHY